MKVVFDTNVYVSEALFNALAEVVILAGREGLFYIYISDFILGEIHEVLLNHFKTTRRFALRAVERASRFAHIVPTRNRVFPALADQKDNPILETAVNSASDFLVTGDKRLLALSPFMGIAILKVREFHRQLKDANLA